MSVRVRRLFAAGILSAAIACDGSVSIDNFSSQYLDAICRWYARCSGISDSTYCHAYFGTRIAIASPDSIGATIAAAKAGKITFDAHAAATCFNTISNLTCNESPFSIYDVPGCTTMFVGTLMDGETCTTDFECKLTSHCEFDWSSADPCTTAVCKANGSSYCRSNADCISPQVCDFNRCKMPVAAGAAEQPCGSNGTCQPSLYCSAGGTAVSTCKPLGYEGGTCDVHSLSCVPGLICVPGDGSNTATCMKPKALGDACSHLYECGGTLGPNICDTTARKCVARPTSGACVGQVVCDERTAYCDQAGTANATCKPYKAVGESCNVSISNECGISDAVCTSADGMSRTGTCVASPVCSN